MTTASKESIDGPVLRRMENTGGSFAAIIADAYMHADGLNGQKLRETFGDLFIKYGATAEPEPLRLFEEQARRLARDQWQDDGRIEVDDNAIVSDGGDNGAYVAAWVWADFTDTPLDRDNDPGEQEAPAKPLTASTSQR